ncbi:haloacid dehalogenase-like protein [Grosmannia clavigera kw1407]|uniref:Phospholipid-transporting ATPase n=1 Tax=Grosmannia clavigera (strain kw1407 / UAMH 11150) TaxID=655863 RepID=F0XJH8_GROCL|nr:haloacid dehalogenase-like protein [Grosmannia clavigera kw1407]EFX02366.1 haloacid dehalogenase-like protein [Grosmannia clavigera kw1407]
MISRLKVGLRGEKADERNRVRETGEDDSEAETPVQQTQRKNLVAASRSWFHRAVTELILRRTTLPPSKDGRHIPLRLTDESARPSQLVDERRSHGRGYVANAIRTSRYTVFDFVPKQLMFQFTRVGNFYFLCVGIPQTIPGVSTTGNFTTIIPLLVFVALTVLKEGYDDYKRHCLDNIENASIATVLRPIDELPQHGQKWWSAFVALLLSLLSRLIGRRKSRFTSGNVGGRRKHVVDNETFAGLHWTGIQWRHIRVGDVVKLSRDEEVPADVLLLHADGEGGLAYVETMALDGETNLKSKQVPTPLADGRCASIEGLASCSAEFVVEDPNPDLYHFDGRITVDKETLPLTSAEVIYRGCTVRNTQTAIGLVVNAGEECKSRMNANRHPSAKKPALELVTNGIVMVLSLYVISLTTGCSIGYYLWHRSTERISWYLSDATVNAGQIIVGFAIQFNNVIPLALYVSLEIVKIGQMLLLNCDAAMYDEASDTPAQCNTNTILENLGQIGYVFSDKTGTLTENVMKFRKLSVAGTSWLHEADLQQKTYQGAGQEGEQDRPRNSLHMAPSRLSTSSRVFSPPREDPPAADASSVLSPIQDGRRSSSVWRSTGRPDHAQPELTTEDLIEYIRLRPYTPFSRKAITYILALALCHTCIPELEDGKVLGFQSSSPDELALVSAAEELGFLVVQKSAHSTTLRFTYTNSEHPPEEVYEIVDVIEFSSQRKRMSIIVRRPDGQLWLICKGADSTVLPRLKMAPLAMQKARDVRKSADMERQMIRNSEQYEPRSSFGGPASVMIRKSIGAGHRDRLDKDGNAIPTLTIEPGGSSYGGPRLSMSDRSRSFDMQRLPRRSMDAFRPRPTSMARGPSLDIPSGMVKSDVQRSSSLANRPLRMLVPAVQKLQQRPPLPDKFSFLEDASLPEGEGGIFEQCFKHIDDFAAEGLRTLLFAHKFISETEYRAWKKEYLAAATSLDDRQERIEAVAETLEQNLSLIGASAIEDKLQKGVPETVDKFRRANIKIWMLTGDKRETAINIAHSARICRPASEIYILDASRGDLAGQMLHVAESLGLRDVGDVADVVAAPGDRLWDSFSFWLGRSKAWKPQQQRRNHTVVVIDGHTLGIIEKQQQNAGKKATSASIFSADADLRELFYTIIPEVDSVICCRASPSQKALLVRSIRQGKETSKRQRQQNPGLTLAIGDGANDLAMLAEAHVGVGVSGREGLQAARVADYSIAQFRFLGRLLLVHGRWNYVRTAQFILSTFWKEMFFYTPAAAYQWYCGYTGTSIYESWSLTVLNTLFTSLCVIIPAIVEQDLSQTVLMAVPELYSFGQRNRGLNPLKYVSWMLVAVAQGVLVWFGCWAGYGAFANSKDTGLFALGDLVFAACIMWTNVKLFILHTHHKSVPVLIGFWLTVFVLWFWNIFLSLAHSASPSPYDVRGGFFHEFGRDLSWWLTLIIVVTALTVIDLSYAAVKRNLRFRNIWQSKEGRQGRHLLLWPPAFWGRKRSSSDTNNEDSCADKDDTSDDSASMEMPADELDLEVWQDLERDPAVRAKLRQMSGEEDDEDDCDKDEKVCLHITEYFSAALSKFLPSREANCEHPNTDTTAEPLAGIVRKHLSGAVGLQPPDLTTVQTLVVLSKYDWGVGCGYRVWMYAGMAARMVQSLMVLTRPSKLSAIKRDEHSRMFWSCFVPRLSAVSRPHARKFEALEYSIHDPSGQPPTEGEVILPASSAGQRPSRSDFSTTDGMVLSVLFSPSSIHDVEAEEPSQPQPLWGEQHTIPFALEGLPLDYNLDMLDMYTT